MRFKRAIEGTGARIHFDLANQPTALPDFALQAPAQTSRGCQRVIIVRRLNPFRGDQPNTLGKAINRIFFHDGVGQFIHPRTAK